jgi:hypothetical protein
MTAQLYRLYNEVARDSSYVFSVVASESEARYVVAVENLEIKAIFNQSRLDEQINAVVDEEGTLPSTSDGWAAFALYNTGNLVVVPVPELESDDTDVLLQEEQSTADYLYKKYAYMKELPNG